MTTVINKGEYSHDPDVNTDVLTHEVTIPGGKLLIEDLAKESTPAGFAHLVEDVVGETTGSNELAIHEGEKARATKDSRGDLILRYWAKRQRQGGVDPIYQVFTLDNGDVIMITAHRNEREKVVARMAHCWAVGNMGDWDFRIIQEREY